jgi:hypothetical protein
MPIKRQSVKVLRLWYRMSLMPEVQALSHPARWWLYGVVMAWTGFNNAAIEFTRRRHAAHYGLAHPAVFMRSRRDVLATGLVMRTRIGGRNLPDQYAISIVPLQVAVGGQNLGTPRVPTAQEIVGTPDVPMDAKTGTRRVPNRYTSRTKENANFPRNTLSSLNRKEKCAKPNVTAIEIAGDASPKSACHEEAQADVASATRAKLRAVH